jgi:hypothetical protein
VTSDESSAEDPLQASLKEEEEEENEEAKEEVNEDGLLHISPDLQQPQSGASGNE